MQTIAQPLPTGGHEVARPSLKATLAAAAGGSLGTAIGSRLAVQGQLLVQKFRESRI
jgi:hypothetical protein